MGSVIPIHSFIIVLKSGPDKIGSIKNGETYAPFCRYHHYIWDDQGIELTFNTRKPIKSNAFQTGIFDLLLGDNLEIGIAGEDECMAYASRIKIDGNTGTVEILSSIIGLPPIFIYQDSRKIVITSDLYFLTKVNDVQLSFSPASVVDLLKVGHPIRHKTLFEGVSMVPGGSLVKWDDNNYLRIKNNWSLPPRITYKDWQSYCEAQIEVFSQAMKRLDIYESFFSLTAGLDTRTILSALINEQKLIPAYTISGSLQTLDAVIARKLCKHYEIDHQMVIIDEAFFRDIEKLMIKASCLSGGLYSFDQATEIYFYERVGSHFSSRISGNLGNQVGRRGTEGISLRNADLGILDPELMSMADGHESQGHWFHQMDSGSEGLSYVSLLQDEIPHSSVGNYCIGNYYVAQKSPYAYKKLFEISQNTPEEGVRRKVSLLGMRLKDLRHRFFGESLEKSFQRMFIQKIGGFAANCPINWGWRASGGISVWGFSLGCLAMVDAFAEKKVRSDSLTERILASMGIKGLHEYRHPRLWTRRYLRTYIYDKLFSRSVEGFFNKKSLNNVLDDYFIGMNTNQYPTIVSALDLSFAKNLFIDK